MIELENMRPQEEVLKVVKRHWIVFVMLGVYAFLGLILTITYLSFFGVSAFSLLVMVGFWQILSLFLYIEWLNNELDMYVVTNNRIIGVDQISFLNRTVSECNLGQVQEVNSATRGLFANLLNYGSISIQTAGSLTTLSMGFAPNALQSSRKILNIVDDYRDKNPVKVEKIRPTDGGHDGHGHGGGHKK